MEFRELKELKTIALLWKRQILLTALGVMTLLACTSNLKKENQELRNTINERREQLEANLQENLESARQELATTDSLLTQVRREHDVQHEWVMNHAKDLNEQSPEVLRLNSLRAQRDSLQVEFEKQAQKVKFFMSKVK